MIYKVPMNDAADRLALVALLAANNYVVWIEHQIGEELFLPNQVVCFCKKSDTFVRCKDDHTQAEQLVNSRVAYRVNCGGTYQLRQYE